LIQHIIKLSSSSEETFGVNKNNCTRFKELRDARKLHPRNFITAYLNVNSIRYKLDEIRELLTGVFDSSLKSRSKNESVKFGSVQGLQY
jgi:hypothetical protein